MKDVGWALTNNRRVYGFIGRIPSRLQSKRTNIYYDKTSASCHEREHEDVVVTKADLPTVPKITEITSPDVQAGDKISEAEILTK